VRIPVLNRIEALAAALALFAGAACTRSFDNPAEHLRAGEVSGRVLLPGGAAVSGAAVSLRGSAMDQATRPTGRFSLLPLPRGHHVIVLRQGQDRALLREVDVGYGSGGQLEGVSLGNLPLPRAMALSGTLTDLGGGVNLGVIVDETTGMAVSANSLAFRFDGLPVGTHRLLASMTDGMGGWWLAGPISITVTEAEAGSEKIVAPMLLRAAALMDGQIGFRVSSMVSGLASGDVPVALLDTAGAPVTVPAADSNGDRDLTVPEGLYYLQVGDPSSPSIPAPPRRTVIVLAGEIADLGTFVIAGQDTVDAAQLACQADADCGPAPASCVAGSCAGYSAPAFSPATLPLCSDLAQCWIVGDCGMPGDQGPCTAVDPSRSVCMPCHTACTVDGVTSISPSCP
jgi:hypothetical protein